MKDFEPVEAEIIDLGQASTETKGTALFNIDVSGDARDYAAGIAED